MADGFGIPLQSLADGPNTTPAASDAPSNAPETPQIPSAILADPQYPPLVPLSFPVDKQGKVDPLAGAIQETQAAAAKIAADRTTAQKNIPFLQAASAAQDAAFTAAHTANQNLVRIQRFGGAQAAIPRVLSLFDPDWNSGIQSLNVEDANTSAQQAADKAKTMMEINNAQGSIYTDINTLADKIGGTSQTLANYQLEVNKANTEALRAHVEAGQYAIAMERNQRERLQYDIAGQPQEALQAMSAQITKAGPKDPNYAKLGYINKQILDDQTLATSVHQAQTAAASGDIDLENKATQQALGSMNNTYLGAAIMKAQETGSNVVTFQQGKQKINFPLDQAMIAHDRNAKLKDASDAVLASQQLDKNDILNRANTALSNATAIAATNPRARAQIPILRNAMSVTAKDTSPQNVAMLDQQLKIIETQNTQFYAQQAAGLSKEGAAGLMEFSANGAFSPTGAANYLSDVAGTPALTRSYYGEAQSILNKKIASIMSGGGFGLGGPGKPNMTDAQAMAMIASGGHTPKLALAREQALQDPDTRAQVQQSMYNTSVKTTILATLGMLAQSPGASPVWNDLMGTHSSEIMDGGNVSTDKLLSALERRSIEAKFAGGKTDYMKVFTQALDHYGVISDKTKMQNPQFGISDHALEAHNYGGSPRQAMVSDLSVAVKNAAAILRTKAEKATQDDVSGRTQMEAVVASGIGGNPALGSNPIDLSKVPSATGVRTAADMKKLYGVP